MNPKQGQGLSYVTRESGQLHYATNPSLSGANCQSSFRLPAGEWWRVDLVSAQVDPSAAGAAVIFSLRASSSGVQLFYISPMFWLAAAGLEATVNFGVGLDSGTSEEDESRRQSLPDVYLPPESFVVLTASAAIGSVQLSNPILIARSAAPMKQ